jgi:hypothetical protein
VNNAAQVLGDLTKQTHDFVSELMRPYGWDDAESFLLGVLNSPSMPSQLVAAACMANGGSPQIVVPLLAHWRLFTCAAQLLDDLQDGTIRRDRWKALENKSELQIVSLSVFIAQLSHLVLSHLEIDTAKLRMVRLRIDKAATYAASVQGLRPLTAADSIEAYFERVSGKSGEPFATVCWASATIPDIGKEKIADAFYQIGHWLGIAGQLWDDCVDLAEDLGRGEFTLPIIHALNETQHPLQPHLSEMIYRPSAGQVDEILSIIMQMGSVDKVKRMASLYKQRASLALEEITDYIPTGADNAVRWFLDNLPR